MELKKNDIISLEITDMTMDGEGVGKTDGFPFFVKDAITGDHIKARVTKLKKNYGYARVESIITPSPNRVEPVCPIARRCGGCQIQEMSYKAQLEFKENLVKNNLTRIGGLDMSHIEFAPIIGMETPYSYRNKAQFPVAPGKDGEILMGFYAGRTHSVIETDRCHIGNEINEPILKLVREYMQENAVKPYDEATGKGLVRHILIRTARKTGEVMVCLVINGNKLKNQEALITKLTALPQIVSIMININTEQTNVILGRQSECLWGKSYIEDYIGDIKYQISPNSFYQVNPVQTEKLYGKALEYVALTGKETVWDLYCGIGTISLFLAKNAHKVYGVEIVPQAIEDAKKNAAINNITNATFYVGKSEEVLPDYYEHNKNEHADVIVVDPPRKGCDEALLATMVSMSPEKIVYVSCDSATLARDLKYLSANGYDVKKVQCVDQFPHTTHVETVVLMSKVK